MKTAKSLFELEDRCLLYYQLLDDEVTFYNNGFDTRFKFSQLFNNNEKVTAYTFLLEIGEGSTYKCFDENDFIKVDYIDKIDNILSVLSQNFYLFNLELQTALYQLRVYDNRHITICFKPSVTNNLIDTAIIQIIKSTFYFTDTIGQQLLILLKNNNGKYLEVDSQGVVLSTFNNYDQYLDDLKMR